MGYTTDFIGHIEVDPPLNEAESRYLDAFAGSRRWDRPEGPYAVPGNPYAEEPHTDAGDRYNRSAPGQPQLWCQWVPAGGGLCVTFNGYEKFYAPVEWLTYLIDHFLAPDAWASHTDDPLFDGFTFDHVLSGIVVGCRRDTRELFTIVVCDNRVTKAVLRRGDPHPWELPMPYEVQKDQWGSSRRRRNRNVVAESATSTVVELSSRRLGS